jgi:hypothetical protein
MLDYIRTLRISNAGSASRLRRLYKHIMTCFGNFANLERIEIQIMDYRSDKVHQTWIQARLLPFSLNSFKVCLELPEDLDAWMAEMGPQAIGAISTMRVTTLNACEPGMFATSRIMDRMQEFTGLKRVEVVVYTEKDYDPKKTDENTVAFEKELKSLSWSGLKVSFHREMLLDEV